MLRLVTTGLANKQIGRKLGISERTVKAHLTSIFALWRGPSNSGGVVGAPTSRRRLRHPYLHVVVGSGVCLDLSLTPTARRRAPLFRLVARHEFSAAMLASATNCRRHRPPGAQSGWPVRPATRERRDGLLHLSCDRLDAEHGEGEEQTGQDAGDPQHRREEVEEPIRKQTGGRAQLWRRHLVRPIASSVAPVPRPTSVPSSPWREPLAPTGHPRWRCTSVVPNVLDVGISHVATVS